MMSSLGQNKNMGSVLFVDDEANILSSIRRAVIDEEYTAYFANGGVEALKIMEEHEISVIVTDMKMPGMDGLQLLKIVKEKYPNIVKIVLSGYTQLSQVLATVNQADIFNFIAKPWDMETELKYVIDKALEHSRLKKSEITLQENLEKRNMAYQNVLKKMEASSGLRSKQMQYIKKMNHLVLESLDRQAVDESRCLAILLKEYLDKLPGIIDEISLESIMNNIQRLIQDHPRYNQVPIKTNEFGAHIIRGSAGVINFAVNFLLTLLQVSDDIESLYCYMVAKEENGKILLSLSFFFSDETGFYQNQFAQCSYKLAEEIFSDILEAKFMTSYKSHKQVIQLEFTLDKV